MRLQRFFAIISYSANLTYQELLYHPSILTAIENRKKKYYNINSLTWTSCE